MPMLWGCMIDVHSKVAMAPSTADPPDCSISLGEKRLKMSCGTQRTSKYDDPLQRALFLKFKGGYSYVTI